ncbi:MAG: tRNA (adenosine(37)-N6)-threonylcarbamoyltransferase complex ATPase subunit type 1 TsaE [Deltaproteobacteria bacterium]|nr:tRNA (adenosine(37)-N6)-threonylcarbamoyltransferase complex ATPase subunit type 1 TsaE [Deltaproteobacteria bacterium]
MEKTEYISKSPFETWEIAEALAKKLSLGDLLLLTGELGSGKTQFVKGLAKGLGIREWMYVVSPSFTLVNVYEGGNFPLFHVDLYRISEKEVDELFIEEMLEEGIVVVEWAEKINWPSFKMRISFEVVGETERKITVENYGTI